MQITGIVEAVGQKFNGSLKVDSKWYNFKKGVKNPGVKVGDKVTLTLQEWEFNGKSGTNITGVTVDAGSPATVAPAPKAKEVVDVVNREVTPVPATVIKTELKGRDFDKEARGKTRCAMFCAALQSPALCQYATGDVDELLEMIQKVADAGVEYSFKD